MVVTCTGCAAAWEVHNSLVRRIGDPDWDVVHERRATAPAVFVRADAAHTNELSDHPSAPVATPSVTTARASVRRSGRAQRFGRRRRAL